MLRCVFGDSIVYHSWSWLIIRPWFCAFVGSKRLCLQTLTKSRVEVLCDAYRNEIQVSKPEIVMNVALSCRIVRGVDANVREYKLVFTSWMLIVTIPVSKSIKVSHDSKQKQAEAPETKSLASLSRWSKQKFPLPTAFVIFRVLGRWISLHVIRNRVHHQQTLRQHWPIPSINTARFSVVFFFAALNAHLAIGKKIYNAGNEM